MGQLLRIERKALAKLRGRLWSELSVIRSSAKKLCRDTDHPADAEAVGEHAESWRPERLGQGHLHLTAGGERGESAVGFGFRRQGERERETSEARTFLAAVGGHECRSADA